MLSGDDGMPEYSVREGILRKQSGGANDTTFVTGRSRRRSIGEFVKKWDERCAQSCTLPVTHTLPRCTLHRCAVSHSL